MKNRGYLIPDPVDPGETVCIRVRVPNHQLYIAAFMRAYAYFGQWVAWERESTGKAAQAAAVWKDAIEATFSDWNVSDGTCGEGQDMDVRQSPTVPCVLEKDTGEGWEQFANLALCAPRLRVRNGVIQQETSEGTWENVSVDDEASQDRFDGAVTPIWADPPSGQTGNCLGARNASAYVNSAVYQIANAMGATTEFAGMLALIMGYLGGAVTGILEAVSLMLLTIAAWEVGEWNDIRDLDTTDALADILQCLYEPDGTMTRESWSAAKGKMSEARGDCSVDECVRRWSLLIFIVDILGPVGMGRVAGSQGITSGTCDDCHESGVITFGDGGSDLSYSLIAGSVSGGGNPGGSLYDEGQNNAYARIEHNFGVDVSVYEVSFDSKGNPGPGTATYAIFKNSAGTIIDVIEGFPPGDDEWHFVFMDRNASPVTGVRSVIIGFDTSGSAFFHEWLDNIRLVWEE